MIAEKSNAPKLAFLKAKEFDIPPQRSMIAQMDAIEEWLTQQHTAGNIVLVMVDEAQLMRLEDYGVHPFPAQLRNQH